ncbi:OLC1v1020787C1 [Oldenlandia corymbosa var. corymbosa]|uniref:OLC1v1020787C1 n=1 Tax=Oldenlandia corymbosa var. corymbosa TaxID=529605 RepID=A0AAV1BU86_OLDCO|nr:OLC1v1020787C1 [Oldenlandia corymbosa var. corymbosa]
MVVSGPLCSKEHLKIYQEWFNFADSDGDGRLTGNDAANFFSLSNLSRPELKQVWALADSKRQGFLGLTEFITAMQLISLAQEGHQLSSSVLRETESENLPVMVGLDDVLEKSKGSLAKGKLESTGTPQTQSPPTVNVSKKKSAKKSFSSVAPVTSVVDGLKRLYFEKLKPLEVTYRFNDFGSPSLTSSDFDAKPMVMLLGQYSTGKTTFIKHLLGCSYPGAHIGPEPTTDRFIAVMSGPDERSIPGNTIAVHEEMPFTGLSTFGGAFLSKFECSQMPHPLLDHITFVDTPGVLSGEKQRTQRSYDFTGVISWFAAKADLILLLFDPHKLDISDEFNRVISSLRGNDDKIRVVLNKADQVDTQQLMRVYGALMWSLGKILNTPEVVRVYIGSFNDKPVNEGAIGPMGKDLFEREQDDLLVDLMDIPKKACDRKINEVVKRARAAKIHAYIMSHLKKEMPSLMGKSKAQQRLINNLEQEFSKVEKEFHLPGGDFPSVEHFREVLKSGYHIDEFEKLKPRLIQSVDTMLGYDIPELLKKFRNPYD